MCNRLMRLRIRMVCFHGIIGIKAMKCYAKLVLVSLCIVMLTLTFCSEFLTAMKATFVTNSVLGLSWYSYRNIDQSFRPPCQLENSSREGSNDSPSRNHSQILRARCLPRCIIFGVSKCGTRALLEYLILHPDVVAPVAEVNYFCNKSLYERGISWYIQKMPLSEPHQVTVEKSPDYFQCHRCADLIYATNNSTKLILLLRDPVERLVSQYMQLAEKHPDYPKFEEWIITDDRKSVNTKLSSLTVGAYSEHLSRWLNVFPRNQIHIIESDSLRINPLEEMKQIERFLGLKPFFAPGDFYFNSSRGFYCTRRRSTGKTKCLGRSKGRQHISVDNSILEKLHEFYKPYNDKLTAMLGLKFPWT